MSFDNFYAIGAAVIGFTVWLVRLEGRVNYIEKQCDSQKTKLENLDSTIVHEISLIREGIADIKGYLRAKEEKND